MSLSRFPPPRSPHRLKVRFRCPRCRPLHFTRGGPAGGVGRKRDERGGPHEDHTRGTHRGSQATGVRRLRAARLQIPLSARVLAPAPSGVLVGRARPWALGRGGEKLREITRGQSARGAGAGGGATGAERRRSHGCGRLGRRRCGVRCAGEGYVCSREQQSTRTRHTRGRLRNTTPRNASARRTRTRHTQRSGVTQRNTPLPETNPQ